MAVLLVSLSFSREVASAKSLCRWMGENSNHICLESWRIHLFDWEKAAYSTLQIHVMLAATLFAGTIAPYLS